ncbi:unnamed protein product [Vitrella brassicaformis CCMP3155]|uniref:Uncharacterized protein n=1 Tax=Vitrella brassicaformis (strain CCMP3155) TaxID=1169540 RepID=A0A0G4FRY9_VITBC|nr:unnamed protein product [Vitrella brassicaformis CCMP3155]|mmetsp:Transcript_36966/g.92696  ORF Transcript_36966/g.92696 Transcript_36966/m.92696 type:complete len:134 (-) Transcript_36966:20-421(-)|eukprot:CEM16871.1 unnamed protein product [Vitrella brassicaformis CCMP3155]
MPPGQRSSPHLLAVVISFAFAMSAAQQSSTSHEGIAARHQHTPGDTHNPQRQTLDGGAETLAEKPECLIDQFALCGGADQNGTADVALPFVPAVALHPHSKPASYTNTTARGTARNKSLAALESMTFSALLQA